MNSSVREPLFEAGARLLCRAVLSAVFLTACYAVIGGIAWGNDFTGGRDGREHEILRLVLEMNRANYESLETWTGTALWTQTVSGRAFSAYFEKRTIEASIDFAVRSADDSFRWNVSRALTRTQSKSGLSEDHGRHFTAGLAVGDEFYNFGPEPTERGDRKRTYALRDRRDYAFSTDDFRPHKTCFFGTTISNLHERLESYIEWTAEGSFDGSVRVDGDLVILRTRADAEPYRGNEYIFDLSKGGNLVRWYASDGPGDIGEDTIDYALHNGVWVPVKYKRRTVRGEDYIEEIEYIFESQEVNGPLSNDEFTLAAIEGKPGDEIFDFRTHTRHVYQPETAAAKEAVYVDRAVLDSLEVMPEEDTPAPAAPEVQSAPEPESARETAWPDPTGSAPSYITIAVAALAVLAAASILTVWLRGTRRAG